MTLEFICRRCGYKSNLKANIKRHFLKKKVCPPICSNISIQECYEEILGLNNENSQKCVGNALGCVENALEIDKNALGCVGNALECVGNALECVDNNLYKCAGCNKTFKHRRYLKQHISRYNCKQKCKEDIEIGKSEAKSEVETRLLEIVKNKDEIINELKNQIEKLLTKVGNTTNNTTNNNTININIRAFGEENLDYIKGGFIKELINRGPYSAIPKLLKEIHFNPEHMENNNVKILNRKEKYAKRYNGEKWEFADKNLTLEDMSDRAFNVLTEYGSGKKFDKFYDDYDDRDTGLLKKMKKDTEMMILNNQDNM